MKGDSTRLKAMCIQTIQRTGSHRNLTISIAVTSALVTSPLGSGGGSCSSSSSKTVCFLRRCRSADFVPCSVLINTPLLQRLKLQLFIVGLFSKQYSVPNSQIRDTF